MAENPDRGQHDEEGDEKLSQMDVPGCNECILRGNSGESQAGAEPESSGTRFTFGHIHRFGGAMH